MTTLPHPPASAGILVAGVDARGWGGAVRVSDSAQLSACPVAPVFCRAGIWKLVVGEGGLVQHIWVLRQFTREEIKHRVGMRASCCYTFCAKEYNHKNGGEGSRHRRRGTPAAECAYIRHPPLPLRLGMMPSI